MIFYATPEQVRAYETSPGQNQSSLKKLFGDPSTFNEKESEYFYEEKEWAIIGTGVDVHLTQGEASYRNQFYNMDSIIKPSDTLMSCMQQVFAAVLESGEEIHPDFRQYAQLFHASFNEHQYFMTRFKADFKEDTRINVYSKNNAGASYWNALMNSVGRQIVTKPQDDLIWTSKNGFLKNSVTSPIFTLPEGGRGYDLVCQLPIFFTYKDVACKGLLDLALVNHHMGKIFPLDVKTTGKYYLHNFWLAAKERRYDFQAAFYSEGIKSAKTLEIISNIVGRDCSQYTIQPFAFVADSLKTPGNPAIFKCTPDYLKMGEFGRAAIYLDGVMIKEPVYGFSHAIDNYKYYCEHGFDTIRVIKESKGHLDLNWEGIS